MKIIQRCLAALLLGAIALPARAQSATAGPTAQAPARAVVEGVVTKDPGSEPVKKALIELIAENQREGGDYTAITGADGSFHIEGIVPGHYRLIAERTGFIEVEKRQPRSEGRVLTLTAGQELKEIAIHLQPTAAVDGRVTDEDGDPLPNAQVTLLRQTFTGGRSRWEQAGAERTNDLGEYRIAGLAAGRYYISVTPPPDFKSLIEAASNAPAAPTGEQECPTHTADNCAPGKSGITSYATTYYPDAKDRAQAAPVQLHAGDNFPANFSLTPSPSVTIRGSVGNLPAGSAATVMLRSADFDSMLNGGEVRKDGSFEIRDVSPGSYELLATVTGVTPVAMMARQSLEVGAENINGLHLWPQPGGEIRGRLRWESKGATAKLESGEFFLALRSAGADDDLVNRLPLEDGFSNLARVSTDGSFEWKNVPAGRYFVVLAADGDSSPDWFLKSAVTSNRDVVDAGFSINGGTLTLDPVVSGKGAVAEGIVTNHKGDAVSNATVVLVPEERFRSRTDRYRKTISDQNGRFVLHGIPPGAYTLLAWESMDGEGYYNPEFLKSSDGQGRALRISEGEHNNVQIEAVPASEDAR